MNNCWIIYTYLVLFAFFTFSACSSSNQHVVVVPPKAQLCGIAVDQVKILYDTRSRDNRIEAFKRSQDVLEQLWKKTNWKIFAPNEFSILDPKNSNLLMGTDLVVRAKQWGIEPQCLSVLKISVTERKASSQAKVTKKGKSASGSDFQQHLSIGLNLQDMQGTLLVELETLQAVDPFAEHPDYDNRPELRQAIVKTIDQFVDLSEDFYKSSTRPEFEIITSPAVVLNAIGNDGLTLRQQIEKAGPLEKDQKLWLNMQYFLPEISLQLAKQHLNQPSGACFGEDVPLPLKPGDCVMEINGTELTNFCALGRQIGTNKIVKLRLIGKDGNVRSVSYP